MEIIKVHFIWNDRKFSPKFKLISKKEFWAVWKNIEIDVLEE